jgi:glucan 1,3-beta-glucosidase
MAVLQTSIAIFIAHIFLLLGLPATLVGAVPVTVPVTPVKNVLQVATNEKTTAATSSYWVANVKRQGTVPFVKNSDYKVFRNVMDFGATGKLSLLYL